MGTISILANTVRPSVDHRWYDTAFGAGTFSWQDPVHSWKAGPGEVMTVEKQQHILMIDSEQLLCNMLYIYSLFSIQQNLTISCKLKEEVE